LEAAPEVRQLLAVDAEWTTNKRIPNVRVLKTLVNSIPVSRMTDEVLALANILTGIAYVEEDFPFIHPALGYFLGQTDFLDNASYLAWYIDGYKQTARSKYLRARMVYNYGFTRWLAGRNFSSGAIDRSMQLALSHVSEVGDEPWRNKTLLLVALALRARQGYEAAKQTILRVNESQLPLHLRGIKWRIVNGHPIDIASTGFSVRDLM